MRISRVAICGMGALGMLYGTHIIDREGAEGLYYVMDAARLAKYSGRSFYKNGAPYALPMRDAGAAEPVDLLIVAVKATGLDAAMEVMRNCVGPDTIILSVMNGITSEELLSRRFGSGHLIYAVAQGMDAVKSGERLTYSNMGQLIIGAREPEQRANVEAVHEYFERIALPHAVEADIMRRLWGKLMLNVGINQACMVYETTYGGCLDPEGEPYRTMIAAMREVIAVAKCEGVELTEGDLSGYVRLIATLDPNAMPSMRQDGLARRPSEVELFAGTIRAIARRHGILVPANDFLYRRVREIEASYRVEM